MFHINGLLKTAAISWSASILSSCVEKLESVVGKTEPEHDHTTQPDEMASADPLSKSVAWKKQTRIKVKLAFTVQIHADFLPCFVYKITFGIFFHHFVPY